MLYEVITVGFKYEAYSEKHKRVSHIIAIIAKRDPYKRFPALV